MLTRILTLCTTFLSLCAAGIGQQTACKTVEIPVGVIGVTGDVFRGLAAEDFIGHMQKKTVSVKALKFDDGPRRVLIVADVNKKLSPDSRKAEAEMLDALLDAARPEDTFAIMAAHGQAQEVNFTREHADIKRVLNQPGDGKRGKDPGVLDTVMAGIEWFGAPQPGDAIVVIAADTEGNHKTNPKAVAKALVDHHIRMFGLALGPVQTQSSVATSTVTSTTTQGLAEAKPLIGDAIYVTGDEYFFPLTANSGGVVLGAINGSPKRTYKMDDPKLVQEVRQKARSVAKMISAYYRMEIDPPQIGRPEPWSLEVNEEIRKHSQQMWLLFPHELGPC